jgi:lipopolysaccharide/colanic/teichoic acid biosynthesis glycosyltransferase
VPAGLTGLAQIRDRQAVYTAARFDSDIEYVATASLLTDLEILARTLPKVYDRG